MTTSSRAERDRARRKREAKLASGEQPKRRPKQPYIPKPRPNNAPDPVLLKQHMEDGTPWTTMGKIFGMSDNGVRKWARKYGFEVKRN